MARGGGRNLGFMQSIRVGSFLTPAGGSSVTFRFDQIPAQAPGGGRYEIVNIRLRYPVGAIQLNVPAGQILTARTIWGCFNRFRLALGTDTPQAKMLGPSTPNVLFDGPAQMIADALAIHSGMPICDVDGAGINQLIMSAVGPASAKPTLATTGVFNRRGWSWQHGPFAVGAVGWGANESVDLIFPLGVRREYWGTEDLEDQALPSHWLSGLGPVPMQPAEMVITSATTTEGGAAVTHAQGVVCEVWMDIVVCRDGRASCPALPIFRFNAPPGNTTDVRLSPGFHFLSGFTQVDTTGRGNVNANLDELTQTFGSFLVQQGDRVAQYTNPADYLKSLSAVAGYIGDQHERNLTFGDDDNPVQPLSMAVVRSRGGIFPIGIPLPILLGMGSDALQDLRASYTAANPANPYLLENVYPLHTKESMELAARSTGMANAVCVNAVDSVNPEPQTEGFLPKMIRVAAPRAA